MDAARAGHLIFEDDIAAAPVTAARARPPLASRHLAGSREGLASLPALLAEAAIEALSSERTGGPLPTGTPIETLSKAGAVFGPAALPRAGMGAESALRLVARTVAAHGLDLTHPRAAAHLQPPPLAVAVAADALASACNASLDTYDSGPSGIAAERWLIEVLKGLAQLGPGADGVMTPGGSMSNLLGLMLARDAAAFRLGIDARRQGVLRIPRPLVFCSELAHFSVHRACAALGLGEDAVHPLPTDRHHRIRPEALRTALVRLGPLHTPLAIVATAGTTDFGSIDPLPELADIAAEHGIWLHVDAAYGFGALFSDALRRKLVGLERASSITLDLHKLGWQPAAASVLLVSDSRFFQSLEREVAYLNPGDDSAAGLDGLLGRSLQTTRRADAFKVVATLLAHGQQGLGEMVDTCHALARRAQSRISTEPELELVAPAELTTVVFRYRPLNRARLHPCAIDELNGSLRRRLLESGTALIGRTSARLPGSEGPPSVCLKLTLLNPTLKSRDVDALVDTVLHTGRSCAAELGELSR